MNRNCWQVSSGNENWFPSEKWWKVKEVFLQGRERRRAVRGQRYTEKREISRSTCGQCRVTNLRSFKALQTLTSQSLDGNAHDLPFTPSSLQRFSVSLFFLFLNTWKSLPLFLFSIEWNNPVSCHLSLRLSVSTCLFHLILSLLLVKRWNKPEVTLWCMLDFSGSLCGTFWSFGRVLGMQSFLHSFVINNLIFWFAPNQSLICLVLNALECTKTDIII